MRKSVVSSARRALWGLALIAIGALWGLSPVAQQTAYAQGGFGNNLFRSVGGVAIDTSGVLRNVDQSQSAELAQMRAELRSSENDDVTRFSPLRKVSLRRLQETLAALPAGAEVPQEVALLAGLQRVQYVFVYPEERDIVLVGPAEGWKLDKRDTVVGLTTNQPVMLLDDLLVALRHSNEAVRGGITCSIDPTQEGMQRLSQYVSTLRTIGNPQATSAAIEQALGPQKISVTGVPGDSHFSVVMVAADYRMKRIGMGLEPSPVQGLPSYLSMATGSGQGMSAVAPRWWMVPDYQPLLADRDGLAWELRGGSVKTLTEDTYLGDGSRRAAGTGRTSVAAQQWAEKMTEKFPELAVRDGIFGELRNVMELAVVSALIRQNDLISRAGIDLSLLLNTEKLPAAKLQAPRETASQASAVKKGSNWIISASGGVQIEAGKIATKVEPTDKLEGERVKLAGQLTEQAGNRWWWD